MVHADRIAVTLRCTETGANQSDAEAGTGFSTNLEIPFIPRLLPRKGIAHAPVEDGTIDPRTQDTLLQAIARSRSWMDAVLTGKTASFDEIASAERLAERHVRRLVPLAFLSPKIIQAIADGSAPTGALVAGAIPSSQRPHPKHRRLSQPIVPGMRPRAPSLTRRMTAQAGADNQSNRSRRNSNRSGAGLFRKFRRLGIGAQRLGPEIGPLDRQFSS